MNLEIIRAVFISDLSHNTTCKSSVRVPVGVYILYPLRLLHRRRRIARPRPPGHVSQQRDDPSLHLQPLELEAEPAQLGAAVRRQRPLLRRVAVLADGYLLGQQVKDVLEHVRRRPLVGVVNQGRRAGEQGPADGAAVVQGELLVGRRGPQAVDHDDAGLELVNQLESCQQYLSRWRES